MSRSRAASWCWRHTEAERSPSSLGPESEPQRLHDLHDGAEARVAVLAQRLVQALASEPCVVGNLGHSSRTGDVPERDRNEARIIASLFDARIEIGCHVRLRLHVVGRIPPCELLSLACLLLRHSTDSTSWQSRLHA